MWSVLDQDIEVSLRVIDQSTTDGTAEWFVSQGLIGFEKRVMYWRFDPQLGVSAGWNFGLVDAFRESDYCLVVNNDVVLRKDNYISLLRAPGDFVTGVSVDRLDGITGEFVPSIRPHPDFSNFLIRKTVWEKVGPFDESMKLYASDCDYHLRMHQAGINAGTNGLPFFHYSSGTLKFATEHERQLIQAQADLDRLTFEHKWKVRAGSPEYQRLFSPI